MQEEKVLELSSLPVKSSEPEQPSTESATSKDSSEKKKTDHRLCSKKHIDMFNRSQRRDPKFKKGSIVAYCHECESYLSDYGIRSAEGKTLPQIAHEVNKSKESINDTTDNTANAAGRA